jgi:hypothetical protein
MVLVKKDYKVQTGLRMPEDVYEEISKASHEIGISINAYALVLINIGLEVIRQSKEQSSLSLSQIRQYIS